MAKPTRLAALTLGLTAAHVAPLLAMDAKLELPKALFSELTSKNFKDKKAGLLAGVRLALDGKLKKGLALDASTGGLAKLLDALEGTAEAGDESVSEEQHKAMEVAAGGKSELGIPPAVGKEFAEKDDKKPAFDAEAVKDWMRGKGATDEEISNLFPSPAIDEDPDADEDDKGEKGKKAPPFGKDKAAKDAKPAKDADMKEKDKDMVTKPAMDEAIKVAVAAVRETEQGIRAAIAEVKPWIGELSPTLAFDSAAAVRRHALKALGVTGADKLHPDALLPVLQAQAKPGAKPTDRAAKLALDETARSRVSKIAPGLDRISAV